MNTQSYMTSYEILVYTGDKRGAGTDSNVSITLFSKNGKQTGKIPLKNSNNKDPFERKQVDKFCVKGDYIGELTKLHIEHDNSGRSSGWFLDKIVVTDLFDPKTQYVATCNQWLAKDEGDRKISRDLTLHKQQTTTQKSNYYKITVYTGNKSGAGTNSDVSLTLYGNLGEAGPMKLANQEDNFEPGKKDEFTIECQNVGELNQIFIAHNNKGLSAAWFLDSIVIEDLYAMHTYQFPCHRWLAKNEDDGKIARFLVPQSSTTETPQIRKHNQYKVTVFTGNKSGAGTDADVFITLFGNQGQTGQIKLDNEKDNFETGQKDEFIVECPAVGEINKILIEHNNKGLSSGWFLDRILIEDTQDHRTYEFPCNRWLAKDEDDKQIARYLLPKGAMPAKKQLEDGVCYYISVFTGDKKNAGTDAIVSVVMHGKDSSSEEIILSDGKFENNSVDKFTINAPKDLSALTALDIRHNNSGVRRGWYLEKVVVDCSSTGIKQTFPCNNWLADYEGDGRIERRLKEDISLRKTYPPTVPWYVWVHTSDKKEAGTNAQVILVLYGHNGKSVNIKLERNSDALQQGHCDQFKADINDVGIPYKLRVSLSSKHLSHSWHLDRIEMENLKTEEHYRFFCGRWLSKIEDDKQIIRELPAQGPGIPKPLPIVKYIVDIFTGNKPKAGTDANVFINIYGERGDTGARPLEYSLQNKNKFERKQVDRFIIDAVLLNQIRKIRIGHDNTGVDSGWYLDKVVIYQEDQSYGPLTFICDRWLAVNEDDGQIVRELTLTADLHDTTYNVKIKTGDDLQAGTTADIHLQIFGQKTETEKMQYTSVNNSIRTSQREHVDGFTFQYHDLGKIEHIRIGHNGKISGTGWFLDWIEIDVPHRREIYRFVCHRWLDTRLGDDRVEHDFKPTEIIKTIIPYEITVFTGDKVGAATNAKIWIQIYGLRGKTDEILLENKFDTFERNSIDKFVVEAANVGKIEKIRINHNSQKIPSAWYLEKILIQQYLSEPFHTTDRKSDPNVEEYCFICQQWFGKDQVGKETIREFLSDSGFGNMLYDAKGINYLVHVLTGDKGSTGTSANVSIRLIGSKGQQTRLIPLEVMQHRRFEPGNVETFLLEEPDIGDVEMVEVQHDGDTLGDSWFLDGLIIEIPVQERTFYFVCNEWLSKYKGDGRTKRLLKAQDLIKPSLSSLIPYVVNIHTGHVATAGCDCDVSLKLFGTTGSSSEHIFRKHEGNFERSAIDIFQCDLEDIGKPIKLRVRILPKSIQGRNRWFLEKIQLIKHIKQNIKEETYSFEFNDWISHETYPYFDIFIKGSIESSMHQTTYRVITKTSNLIDTSCDANVFIMILGQNGDSGQLALKNSSTFLNKFERGHEDIFTFENILSLGPLKKLLIWHDDSSVLKSAWHLEYVRVDDMKTGQTYMFPCNKWLSSKKDDGQIVRILVCNNQLDYVIGGHSYITNGLIPYEIEVSTSDQPNAGTTQNGWIIVEGNNNRSEKIFFKNTIDNKILRRGQPDTFTFECQPLGEVRRIILGHQGEHERPFKKINDDDANWHVSHITITDLSTGIKYEFPVQKWITINNEGDVFDCATRKENSTEQQPHRRKINYKIIVHTDSISGASTDANVSIILFGTLGNTGSLLLKQKGQRSFQRGGVDEFIFECLELGKLKKLHIKHRNSALSSDWFLDKIEVINMDTNEKVSFPCKQGLGRKHEDYEVQLDLMPI
ncbi:unnamed protein product [Rotaria magnacalcarata]|uniref:PLAT domain-containing protein n=2 Tax=Rotaria magnacalcarata TaxID=392030 RepID=A0A816W118_9BILA|nr:unnamed protein product [Rotaria magnacalcarata]CAF3890675.1 unnamed protein product [Rotaria magnacalcarata]